MRQVVAFLKKKTRKIRKLNKRSSIYIGVPCGNFYSYIKLIHKMEDILIKTHSDSTFWVYIQIIKYDYKDVYDKQQSYTYIYMHILLKTKISNFKIIFANKSNDGSIEG